ncbi:prepilin peptidase [Tsukamurella asaccharolytica]|uniref:Prepilin peptidase n=1 Tax=Tsukamurella asaccharolytica TaxID=2592067 RepID=A0A5C5RA97_9ACTN|nr:A24 family peptidase [Tsukamurella asaccharolytica]TWS20039.1 prepilin peptidase [Tsukamurella asaccharolytica]
MEWGLFGGVFLAWCAALCWFDVRERRLPNLLTLPAASVALAGALWVVVDGALAPLIGAVLWTAVNGAAFLGRGMGAGDVKLAPTLGAVVAAAGGVPSVLLAILGAQLLTLAWALSARDRTVPHGPAMIAAAVLAAGFAA